MSKRTCMSCKYWKIGIPCGTCSLDFMLFTNDKMVFEDASDKCPLEKGENNEN